MGKNTEDKHHGGIPTDKSNNRKWAKMLNNLNVLDYHRWNVKKILPHKKHGETKDGDEVIEANGEETHVSDKGHQCNGDVCTLNSSQPEEKIPKDSNVAARKGRATRIKEKITKEVMKKRVTKHKSSPSTSSSITGQVDNDSSHDSVQLTNEVSVDGQESTVVKESSCVEPQETDEKPGEPSSTQVVYEVVGDNVTQDGEKSKDLDLESSDEEQTSPPKLKNVEHFGRSATFHQSKELLDAMDVLSMNKDFFLKVLEDPQSSLAQHFMVQQASNKRKHLDRSRTFSHSSASSSSCVRPERNSSFKESNGTSIGPLSSLPKSEMDVKPFRDLRQKIRHVIKESKEERQRIALDSVLHKVPYGQQRCTKTNKDVIELLDLESDKKDNKKKIVKRWPSLNVSMEKYCQLLETSSNKGSKSSNSDNLKVGVKDENETRRAIGGLGRMLSSPDLSMCLSISTSKLPSGISLPKRMMRTSMSFNGLNSQLMLPSLEKIETKSGSEEIERRNHESNTLVRDGPDGDHDDEHNVNQSPEMEIEESQDEYPSKVSKTDSCLSQESEQTDLFSISETSTYLEKLETEALDPMSYASPRVHVKSKDQEHFDYVRDILQLSGYSENLALGTWQTTSQPVDLSLFAELESCSLQEPDCEETEEVTRSNRLLLFDSINEVLLSTYESSTAYWKNRLTICSRIHPMPKGYRVLEKVWSHISWYLNSDANQLESSLDYVIMHDLDEDDGWMNLQFEAESIALLLEDLIFEELLMEVIPS